MIIRQIICQGVRVPRGCATKRPMLYVECEAHKSKNVLEEFCYCSFDLCNQSSIKMFSCTLIILTAICQILYDGLLGRL